MDAKIERLIKTAKQAQKTLPRKSRFALMRKQFLKKAGIDETTLEELQQITLQENLEETSERLEINMDILGIMGELQEAKPDIKVLDEMIEGQKDTLRFNVEDSIRQKEELQKLILFSKLKKAGVDNPQSYEGIAFQDKEKKESSERKEDTESKDIIDEIDDPERFVFESKIKLKRAILKLARKKQKAKKY